MEEEDYLDSPWNSVGPDSLNRTLAQSIGVPEDSLDISKSYHENGGNSFTMMSAFLSLKQQGSAVSLEEFLNAKNLEELHITPPSASVSGPSDSSKFQKKALSEVSAEKAQNLLAKCFTEKGRLKEDSAFLLEDFAYLIRMVWPKFLHDLSFAMLDAAGEIVGVAALADSVDVAEMSNEGCHPYLQKLFVYLDSLTESVQHHFPQNPQRGTVLVKVMIGTAVDTNPSDNVLLMYLMVDEIHRLAKEHKFKISVAQNSSPITQELAEYFGCKRLLSDVAKHHVNAKGEKPFAKLPDSSVVCVDIKEYQ